MDHATNNQITSYVRSTENFLSSRSHFTSDSWPHPADAKKQ
jgi:hypothetical protein